MTSGVSVVPAAPSSGPRPESTLDPTAVWPDACRFYGYAFHEYPELAQDCDGFKTPSQYQRELEMKNRKEKMKAFVITLTTIIVVVIIIAVVMVSGITRAIKNEIDGAGFYSDEDET